MRDLIIIIFVFLIIPLPISLLTTAVQATYSDPQAPTTDYTGAVSSVNMTAVKAHVAYFSSLGTRETGTAGNLEAAEYIRQMFINIGLENVTTQDVTLPNTIDYGANITLPDDRVLRVYPMEPNLVVPSTTTREGLTGLLVYGGDGWLADLEGKPINGSIVILNWNSGNKWLLAASLGAKAVIFIPPPEETNWNPPPFTATAPINFPRFYADRAEAEVLLQSVGETVRLVARTVWEEVTSPNIIGVVKGIRWNENIVLSAYYDTHTPFPSIAPGAQEALGVATLLELAKYFKAHPPEYNIIFLATTAHHQNLMGAVQFYDEYVFQPALKEALARKETGDRWAIYATSVKLWFHLQPYTGSSIVYATNLGLGVETSLAGSGPSQGYPGYQPFAYLNQVLDEVNQQKPLGKTYAARIESKDFEVFLEAGYALTPPEWYETDRALSGGIPCVTFTTAYDVRPTVNTPWDTVNHVNWDNLETQLQLVYALLQNILNIDNAVLTQWWNEPPWGEIRDTPWRPYPSFCNYTAQVVEWDEEKAWYKPVPNALGMFFTTWSPTPVAHRFPNLFAKKQIMFAFADDDGRFQIFTNINLFGLENTMFMAWVIDNETGNVLYVPDQGVHAWPRMTRVSLDRPTGINVVDGGFVTVFKASTAVIYNMVDSNSLFGGAWVAAAAPGGLESLAVSRFMPGGVMVDIQVFNIETHSTPQSYSIHWTGITDLTTAVVAFPPKTSVEFKFMVPGREIRYPEAILNNASSLNPYGTGYVAKPGEQLHFTIGFLDLARNLFLLNEERVEILVRVNPQEAKSPILKDHYEVPMLLVKAEEALAKAQYGRYLQASVEAWRQSEDVYKYTRSTLEDAASTVPYFALILLPFIIMAERAIFNLPGIKKVLSYLLIGGLAIVALYFLHPGFSVAASPASIMIGTSLLLLSIPLFLIMLGRTLEFVEALSIRIYGKHAEEVSKASLLLTGLFLGVDHMRKRKMRAALTLATIIIMVMAFVNMVSISAVTITNVRQYTEGVTADYNGVYIHQLVWGSGEPDIGTNMFSYLEVRYSENATIIPRAWLYTPERYGGGAEYTTPITLYEKGKYGFRAVYNDKKIVAWCLLGLSSEESEATKLDKWLVAGRWFLPTDDFAIILTEKQANSLGIDPKALPVKVLLGDGIGEFAVVGIISKDYFSVKDLDAQEITPLDLHTHEVGGFPKFDRHEPPDNVFIVTYHFVTRFNYYRPDGLKAYRASVTLIFKDPVQVNEAANQIFKRFPGFVIYSKTVRGLVTYRWKGLEFKAMGLEFQAIPIVLVVLSILNLMVATVYERRRDVFTFGSLGMSPAHVGAMFFSEAVVYGLMGAVVGYILAILSSRIALAFMPGYITLNYSSSWVANSLSITMLTVIGSSIYPIFLASRMVTPSLKRVWEIPTAPVGDRWEIPMPFYASTDEEANGIIAYLHEYVAPHMTPRAPIFSARDISIAEGKVEENPIKTLEMTVSLTPYEASVTQKVTVLATKTAERWEFRVILERMTGLIHDWESLNHKFLTELRGQLLMWRVLPAAEKAKYTGRYGTEK